MTQLILYFILRFIIPRSTNQCDDVNGCGLHIYYFPFMINE